MTSSPTRASPPASYAASSRIIQRSPELIPRRPEAAVYLTVRDTVLNFPRQSCHSYLHAHARVSRLSAESRPRVRGGKTVKRLRNPLGGEEGWTDSLGGVRFPFGGLRGGSPCPVARKPSEELRHSEQGDEVIL